MQIKMQNTTCKIKIKEPFVGRKATLSYILFLLFTLHIVLLTSLTGCGRKAPPVPPEASKSFSDISLQIANVLVPPFYKK